MPVCSVRNCKNRSKDIKENHIQFFSFLKNEEYAQKWSEACNKEVNLNNGKYKYNMLFILKIYLYNNYVYKYYIIIHRSYLFCTFCSKLLQRKTCLFIKL